MSLLPLMLAACSEPPSDAALYRRALVEAADYPAAARACGEIRAVELAGDCQVAVMERFESLSFEDCAAVASGLWRDECYFLLAERQWRSGKQVEGLDTCRQTRFARSCTWHLIQDEAEAAVGEDAVTAEARLAPFLTTGAAPDAALHFWKLWLRGRLFEGHPIDEAVCASLTSSRACREAVGRTIHELLAVERRQDPEALCAAEPGQRVIMNGQPAWTPGPLSTAAEQQWVSRHCSTDAHGER